MPVKKFRSVEEMEAPIWRSPGDPALYQAMAALWELARRTRHRTFPRGVGKYTSVEEMSRAQEMSNRQTS
jgi:hypothetical protein